MGFNKVAKHYYTGWHEPGSMLELTFNKDVWKKLSKSHQAIIESVSAQMNSEMAYEFQAANAQAYAKLAKSKKIMVSSFPTDVVKDAKKAFDIVIKEQSEKSKDFKKVWKSCESFLEKNRAWSKQGVQAYLNTRA